jgi:hypothetical protein
MLRACRFRGQGLKVVADDFRGEVIQRGLLRQAGDVLAETGDRREACSEGQKERL